MYKILICDDQPDIVNALKIYLAPEGYTLLEAYNGADAVKLARENDVHLILLDIMMPGMDGITATSKIREFSNGPIILLTAKSETEDKVLGLNVGADDYITKPFAPVEVLARVKSQLRRFSSLGSRTEDSNLITLGGIVLDDRTKQVTVEGEPVSLTPTEYAILKLLMSSPGKVFSTKVLYESVWQEVALGSEGAVAVHIRHLREKIEIDPKTCAIKNPSLSKYIIESSMDVPEVYPIVVCSDGDAAPYGAKGIGEPALIPSIPATMAAIGNALGVKFHHTPVLAVDIVKAWKDKQAAEAAAN